MMNVTSEICKSFSKQAQRYEQAARVQHEIGMRLFERLDYLKITPRYILDVGCGTGVLTTLLHKKYPKAQVMGVDLAHAMLLQAKRKQGFWKKWPLINADMDHLPFPDNLFDLVIANQAIHWSSALTTIFKELNRVMNVNGCLMFSTLGPDTFKELRQAWNDADNFAHTNHFKDMHDIGDCLLKQRFVDPVMDMEYLTVNYSNPMAIIQSLKHQGVRNINPYRNKGLTGKQAWKAYAKNYPKTSEDKYPLTYEVLYGHAWKGMSHQKSNVTETFISIDKIGGR